MATANDSGEEAVSLFSCKTERPIYYVNGRSERRHQSAASQELTQMILLQLFKQIKRHC